MKEFVLTQPYANLDEMVNSAEVAVYKEELQQGNIEKYAIVSRIGNRYDLDGNKVEDFADNPFIVKVDIPVYCKITNEDVIEEASMTVEEMLEGKTMKYFEIEKLIDAEIEKAVAEVNSKYEKELALLKEAHAEELAKAKEEVKAELIEKINS
jgi:uncharacterized phage protein gp47/JayE